MPSSSFLWDLQEMYGLSLLMQSSPRMGLDLDPFLEQAVSTYSARGVLQLDSLRSTLLYYEGYRLAGDYHGAIIALLRAAGDVSLPLGVVCCVFWVHPLVCIAWLTLCLLPILDIRSKRFPVPFFSSRQLLLTCASVDQRCEDTPSTSLWPLSVMINVDR